MSYSKVKDTINSINDKIIELINQQKFMFWDEFVDEYLSDIDTLEPYTKLIKAIIGSEKPNKPMVDFLIIKDYFVKNQEKFVDILKENEAIENIDYATIETYLYTKNSTEKLFFPYAFLKYYITSLKDYDAISAINQGEIIYKKFTKYKNTLNQNYWMVVEQNKELDKLSLSLKRQYNELNNPKSVLRIFSGTKVSLENILKEDKNTNNIYKNVIIPITESINITSTYDLKIIFKYMNENLFKDYKQSFKEKFMEKNDKKVPKGNDYQYCLKSSIIIVSPKNKEFKLDNVISVLRSGYLSLLNQTNFEHEDISDKAFSLNLKKYEKNKTENIGKYNAIKANAYYYNIELAKLSRDNKLKRLNKNDKPSTTKTKKKTLKKIPNGFETEDSDVETKPKISKKSKSKKEQIKEVKEEEDEEEDEELEEKDEDEEDYSD